MNWKAESRKILSPQFVIVVTILVVALLSLNAVIASFEWFLSKQPIQLRRPLYQLPATFGHYTMENEAPELTPEIEAVLGANAYITREYRDLRLEKSAPGAIIRLHIAYFTGTPDAVIHVPEVCYIASGAQGRQTQLETVVLEGDGLHDLPTGGLAATALNGQQVTIPDRNVDLRVFDFVPANSTEEAMVTYFFAANGKFMGTTGKVRTLAFDVRDRYAYWCKIECLPLGASNRDQALESVRKFLSDVLPEIMACLPDWDEVRAGRYPSPKGDAVSP